MENRVGFGKRAIAGLIDSVIIILVVFLLGYFVGIENLDDIITTINLASFFFLQYALFEVFTGASIGKLVLGLRIASVEGSHIGFVVYLVRTLLKYGLFIIFIAYYFEGGFYALLVYITDVNAKFPIGSLLFINKFFLFGLFLFLVSISGWFFQLGSSKLALHDKLLSIIFGSKADKFTTAVFNNSDIDLGNHILIEAKNQDRNKNSIVITSLVALVFSFIYYFGLMYPSYGPFNYLYEWGSAIRFSTVRKSTKQRNIESATGNSSAVSTEIPKDALKNIVIIGIDSQTLDTLGEWPIARDHYGNFFRTLAPAKATQEGPRAVLVDVMFLTKKNKSDSDIQNLIIGLKPKYAKTVIENYLYSDQMLNYGLSLLNKSISVDYPVMVSPIQNELPNKANRIKLLSSFALTSKQVKDDTDYSPWVFQPTPPTVEIMDASGAPGFANIRKSITEINFKMPLIAKWYNPYDKKYYYLPNIDLIVLCNYYGIDLKKDVKVVMGKHIKLMNIPKIKVVDYSSFENQMKGIKRDIMIKPNKERSISIPIDDEGFMDINFVGGPKSFESMSFGMFASDIIQNQRGQGANSENFKDKIVLMAMYYATGATTAKDVHPSPFSDSHAGIEHHANALNTVLRQDFIYHVPAWINVVIYFFIAFLMGFAIPRLKIGIGFAYWFMISQAIVAASMLTFKYTNALHVFYSVIGETLLSLIVLIVYRIASEEKNVKYIRSTFSKFVSKDIVNELLKDPTKLKLGGEKKEITVLFSDIRGFTTISEKLDPTTLVELLNEYLSEMSEIIIASKGTIDKYIGDAIMAFWGAPLQLEDHAYKSCKSAVDQLAKLAELRASWIEKYEIDLQIGIGLNTGPCVVGNMGSSHRMDYTLMGDTVNLGARLEGTNKVYTTEIIISEFTYEKVKDKVLVRELDKIKVKGKNEPVVIYELLDVLEDEETKKQAEYLAS